MAILLDKAGTQHYANKMVLAENRKVGSKSLPSALADIDGLIDEMKGQFEAEYGSALDMKLENNENVFSVGTGSGVDRRGEVENSFTDIEIKGESLVNLVSSDKTSWTYSGIDRNTLNFLTTHTQPNLITTQLPTLKPKTLYTCIYDISISKATEIEWIIGYRARNSDHSIDTSTLLKTFSKTSTHEKGMVTFTTTDTSGSAMSFEGIQIVFKYNNASACAGTSVVPNIIILEGDYTNKPLPQYFEGLKSVGEIEGNKIEVSSMNKNLLDTTNGYDKVFPTPYNPNNNKFEYFEDGFRLKDTAGRISSSVDLKNFKSGKKYLVSFDFENISLTTENNRVATYYTVYENNSHIYTPSFKVNGRHSVLVDLTKKNESLRRFAFYFDGDNYGAYVDIKNVMIEEVSTFDNSFTEYEYHKVDKKQISLSQPLRGLPNGVKDSIELVNGEWKIIRRCGEIVFNGGENWLLNNTIPLETSLGLYTPVATLVGATGVNKFNLISDRFPTTQAGTGNAVNPRAICWSTNATNFLIDIEKASLSTQDINGFKQWLQANPTKVIYELATPIIEDMDAVTLQCWKNGTLSIGSVIPVESTHTVSLNKPSQIKKNIEELTALRHRVKTLEEQYDQIALEQAHKLELLNHSFELDYNI